MSEPSPPRARRRALFASLGAVAIVTGALAWTLGPGGPLFVAHFAEGRSIWRLGKLHLDGVHGAHLGDLRIAHASLRDGDGVWAEASDLALDWDPLALAFGGAAIREASAAHVHILRRPRLTSPKPPGGDIDLNLSALAITRIDVDAAFLGEEAAFKVDGRLATRGARIRRAVFDAVRLDAPGDALHVDLTRTHVLALDVALDGPADGFFATALKAKERVTLRASANGGDDTGAGRLDARVGDAPLASGAFSWTHTRWTGVGDLHLSAAPALAAFTDACGALVHVEGEGARGVTRAFTAKLQGEHAGLNLSGRLGDDWRPIGAMRATAHADRLQAFVPGVRGGGARFAGVITNEDKVTTADGRLEAASVQSAGVAVSFSGPVRVRLTQTLADIDATATVSGARGVAPVTRLLRDGRLALTGRYDRGAARFVVRAAHFASPAADIAGDGALGPGAPGLRGQ